MEKNTPAEWHDTCVEVRSYLDGMNSFSYKQFVLKKGNSRFGWDITQMRCHAQVGCLTSYKQPLNWSNAIFSHFKSLSVFYSNANIYVAQNIVMPPFS